MVKIHAFYQRHLTTRGSVVFSLLSFLLYLGPNDISISEDEHNKLNLTEGQQCCVSSVWFPVKNQNLVLRQSPEFQHVLFYFQSKPPSNDCCNQTHDDIKSLISNSTNPNVLQVSLTPWLRYFP